MLSSIGVLYDRILAKRLDQWLNINDEQPGFRNGKSTLTHIFTLRLLIEMAKSSNITLYIGCFDIEKAFDKISRHVLFQKLINCGIGHVMLNALKAIYSVTSCILNLKAKNSAKFRTSCGIRQSAPSSSSLFILFMHDLIDYVRDRCVAGPLIETMHVLLHAGDTLIISTKRSLFIQKCNIMLEYFCKNKLKLNLGKSGYITIICKPTDLKTPIDLNNGTLKYKNQITYLGVIFSDTLRINNDIKLFIRDNRNNITMKFSNFSAKNYLAPLKIKLEVLHSCIAPSLCHSCEPWVNGYRMKLKQFLEWA